MITLGFTMSKGGVAKTTSALNIGAAIARSGFRTLLVDMDGQGNLSSTFNYKDHSQNIYTFLIEGGEFPVVEVASNLHLLPGSDMMHLFDSKVKEVYMESPAMLLSERMGEYDLSKNYDFIIFDCPPKLDYNTLNVLGFVEWVFIPVSADKYSLDGVEKTMDVIKRMQLKINKSLKVGGIFLTRYDNRAILSKSIRQALTDGYGTIMMEYFTRNNVAINEAIIKNMDIYSYDEQAPKKQSSSGAADYASLAREIIFITGKDNTVKKLAV